MINSMYSSADVTKQGKIVTKHKITENENEMRINITIKIDKSRKDFEKIKAKMFDKQQSPAIDIIKEIEKKHRKDFNEGKAVPFYQDV